jgi:UDP-N-acetylmuramoyl-L-alanyl-D-glutamate--2,6-diaminopimelate ligase
MKHSALIKLISAEAPAGARFEISQVTEDSRRARPGALFVAVAGEHADGHDHIGDAAARGAVAVVGEREHAPEGCPLPYLRVDNARRAAGLVAHQLLDDPSRALEVIGITGTNGKTSTARLVQAILESAGRPTANFGTLGYFIGGRQYPAAHTTPFAEELAAHFAAARDAAQAAVVMEVSSHALAQDRVAGIRFRVGAFTNLTQDHLDYHGDMEQYRKAKERLFTALSGEDAFGVVNLDDPAAGHFIQACAPPCLTYGKKADCRAKGVVLGLDATRFTLKTPWGSADVVMSLLGAHNVANALCAATVCGGLGVPVDGIAAGLSTAGNVPGRFERVDAGQDFVVVVDYAHTEDGLRNVLAAARALCKRRVLCVFGCGGDRDKTKRPKMGAAAAELSDFCIITADNPRTEDPHRILLDVEVGVQRSRVKGEDYLVIADRAEAIREAVGRARKGDLVLIAGKGHEDYQIIGAERRHFDDREEARKALEARTQ